MGTWSAAILGNDTAFDVHASVLEAYDAGVEPAQLRRRIEEQFASSLRIAEDRNNVWLAMAQALWEIGALEEELRRQVSTIASDGSDLEVWRQLEASPALLKERADVLKKFAARLAQPKKTPRRRRLPPKLLDTPFAAGACLAFRFPSGEFGGALVVTSAFTKAKGGMSLCLTDLRRRRSPSGDDFLAAHVLGFSWEEPWGEARRLAAANGKVGRLAVGGMGYEKSAERARFLEWTSSFFTVVGQLPVFRHVLLATSGMGVAAERSADVAEYHRKLAGALAAFREGRVSRGSPKLSVLAAMLKR
jgi:hypothetical protein